VCVAAVAYILGLLVANRYDREGLVNEWENTVYLCGIFFAVIMVIVEGPGQATSLRRIFYAILATAVVAGLWAPLFELVHSSRVFSAMAILWIAVMLFWLKRHHLLAYAGVEIFFGLATALSSVRHFNNDTLKLGAAVYLLVRGLENARSGMKASTT
jgi:hypothetical protein